MMNSKKVSDLKFSKAAMKKFTELWKSYNPELSLEENMIFMLKDNGIEDATYVSSNIVMGTTDLFDNEGFKKSKEELTVQFIEKMKGAFKEADNPDKLLAHLYSLLGTSGNMEQIIMATLSPCNGEQIQFGKENIEARQKDFEEKIHGLSDEEKIQKLLEQIENLASLHGMYYLNQKLWNPEGFASDDELNHFKSELIKGNHNRTTASCLLACAEYILHHKNEECDIPSEVDDPRMYGQIMRGALELSEAAWSLASRQETAFETWVEALTSVFLVLLIAAVCIGLPILLAVISLPLGVIAILSIKTLVILHFCDLLPFDAIELVDDYSHRFAAWVSYKKNSASRIIRELTGQTDITPIVDKKKIYAPDDNKDNA